MLKATGDYVLCFNVDWRHVPRSSQIYSFHKNSPIELRSPRKRRWRLFSPQYQQRRCNLFARNFSFQGVSLIVDIESSIHLHFQLTTQFVRYVSVFRRLFSISLCSYVMLVNKAAQIFSQCGTQKNSNRCLPKKKRSLWSAFMMYASAIYNYTP